MMATMHTIRDLVAEHPLLADLPAGDLDLIAGCGHNVHIPAGRHLFRQGQPADVFYLVRSGRVAIEVVAPVGQPLVVDEVRAIAVDGACLRHKCESDNGLGYRLMQRFAQLAVDHLQAARLQLLDLYGDRSG